jgi:hypothetical protein
MRARRAFGRVRHALVRQQPTLDNAVPASASGRSNAAFGHSRYTPICSAARRASALSGSTDGVEPGK